MRTPREVDHDPLCDDVPRKWQARTLPLRAAVLDVLATFEGAMSTRQVFYQVVSRLALPNTQADYHRLARLVVHMRREGEIDYGRIVDRSRSRHKRPGWAGVGDIMRDAAHQYRRDIWTDQPTVAMVACEKAALEGVFAELVDEYGAPLWTARGFPSESFLYDWAEDVQGYNKQGQHVSIAYFGDHDPSGLDIERQIRAGLERFGARFDWMRLGLCVSDLEHVANLPTKATDGRSKRYVAEYGDRAAELDALSPAVLRGRVRGFIEGHLDADRWEAMRRAERVERESLFAVASNWQTAARAAGATS